MGARGRLQRNWQGIFDVADALLLRALAPLRVPTRALTTALEACAHLRRPRSSVQLLQRAGAMGTPVDTMCVKLGLNALCELGEWTAAWQLLRSAEATGAADVESMRVFAGHLARHRLEPQHFQGAEARAVLHANSDIINEARLVPPSRRFRWFECMLAGAVAWLPPCLTRTGG